MALSVEEVLKAAGGELHPGSPHKLHFSGYIIDSRSAGRGELFIPLQGEKENGHKFVLDALQRGAAGSMVERRFLPLPELDDTFFGKAVIVVEDTLKALQDIASYHRRRFFIPVVAVTGSNGKTTTKDFAASVLSSRLHVLKTEGNLNNHIGLPLMLLKLEEKHEAAVFEFGMSASGEIGLLTSLANPTVGVLTNIGEAHMEYLGSKENIASAKGELLKVMGDGGLAFLNGDDHCLRRLGEEYRGKVIYYGFGDDVHIKILACRPKGEGYLLIASLPGEGKKAFWIPLAGKHNAYNAAAAIGIGLHFGLSLHHIQEGLEKTVFSEMRLEKILFDSGLRVINDAYNASPTSMRFSLDYLKESPGAPKIAVLGDMLELGGIAEKEHLELGRFVARIDIDYLITAGRLGSLIARGAVGGGMPPEKVFAAKDPHQAANMLLKLPLRTSTVLLKGSRGMRMERVVQELSQGLSGGLG